MRKLENKKIDFQNFLKKQKMPIGVVCNDAGSANLISHWLKDIYKELNINCYLEGPARKIFKNVCPKINYLDLRVLIDSSSTLLTGTGWASTLEHDSRKLMKAKKGKNISVLDHWTNYKERFISGSDVIFPEMIIVSDPIGFKLAKKTFLNIEIKEFNNDYLSNICNLISNIQINANEPSKNILYVLEPIRDDWGKLEQPGEFIALDYFVKNIRKIGFKKDLSIKLRKHPSEEKEKYLNWISLNKSLNISIESENSLEQSIDWADTVVGCQTFAMVIALNAGRKVLTTIPPNMPKCKLPHKDILTIEKLTRIF